MKKPCKVLCLFDYKSFTGFSTVSTNIKKQLKNSFGKDLKLDICAINYFGEPYEEEDGTYVISALKSAPKKDDFGRFGFLKILNESNEYDGIFIIQDLGVISPIIGILKGIKEEKKRNNKKGFKSIFYFPVDCKIIDKLAEGLEFFDCIVSYTEYGRQEVIRVRPDLRGRVKVIPHGTNTKDFFPMSFQDKSKFRYEYFEENSSKFIITNINRNQPRKDIPTTIFSFIEVKKIWKELRLPNEPFLYLHMHPKDPMGWDIRALMLQTDLIEGKDYKLLDIDSANNGSSIENVNKIYNSSDVYLTTTLGEGWGLTFSEACATKTPIVCPLSTSFIEMSNNGKRAYTISDLIPYCNTIDNVIRTQCSIKDTADKIIYVANIISDKLDESHNKMIDMAYSWAKSLDWNEVCKLWIQYFKETY